MQILLAFLCTTAFAQSAPLIVNIDSAREMLGLPPQEWDADYGDVPLTKGDPGLIYTFTPEAHVLKSAVTMAGGLHRRFDYTLVLLTSIDGIDVPGFDGLVLNEDRQVIANFSLKTSVSDPPNLEAFARTFRHAHEFAFPDKWPGTLLKTARRIAGFTRAADVPEVILRDPRQRNRFARFVRAYRLQREVFAVGSGRPTWILIHAHRWTNSWRRKLAGLTPGDSHIERVYVLHRDRLLDLTADCRTELAPDGV